MADVRKMSGESLIRMIGDELYRHTDDTPLMQALDELLRRVPAMEEVCEAADEYFGDLSVPAGTVYLKELANILGRLDAYRAMKRE